MGLSGDLKIKTKLFAAFATISIVLAVFGCLGSTILVLCSMVGALIVGAIISSRVSAHLRKLTELARSIESGEIDENEIADDKQLSEVAASVRNVIDHQEKMADALNQVAVGNFSVNVSPLNERDRLGKALQLCINNGRMLEKEIARVSEDARDGKLRERCNDDTFRGAFGTLLSSINLMLDSVVKPPGRAIKVLTKVVEGDLTVRFTGASTGDHATFQNALNLTIKTLDDSLARVELAAEHVSAASDQDQRWEPDAFPESL